ncbi:hotdog fold domain-containing protein [Brevibacterium renqingii]|uniref:hotdog fold domain-containing protein n=1 Tax=Brevibacterium renqingii TaxID=2776916 RepID=UPI001ADFC9BF|nr:hotdog fold domain-containing protein [Brevibacterium renqingii]
MTADTTTAAETDGAPAIYRLWQKLSRQPLGRWLFTQGVCFKAPYFRTVHPRIRELRPGLCRVSAPNRRGVHNHIGTFHAIASCNMAEIAAGVMTEATVPTTHRWIPTGMTVDYNAKATTAVTAIARLDQLPEFGDEKFDLVVPVDVLDAAGNAFVTAAITMRISKKKDR